MIFALAPRPTAHGPAQGGPIGVMELYDRHQGRPRNSGGIPFGHWYGAPQCLRATANDDSVCFPTLHSDPSLTAWPSKRKATCSKGSIWLHHFITTR